MKKFVLTFLFLFPALVAYAGSVYENSTIDFQRGTARPAPFGKVIFSDSFEKKGVWEPQAANYEKLLKFSFDKKYKGRSCFYIAGEGLPKKDTAWSLKSTRQSLPENRPEECSQFALRFLFSTDQTINGLQETSSLWRSAVLWFDAADLPCGEQQFSFIGAAADFSESVIYGAVPKEAKSFVLQFGFDRPNLDQNKFFALHSVELSLVNSKKPFTQEGWFVSGIFPGGPISWQADIPKGTAIRFQIATAEMTKEKIPDKWSAFHGPDGSDKSFYEKPFDSSNDFVRYKVFLQPKEALVPILKSVTVGQKTDSNWTLRHDGFPPRVKVISQTPTQDRRAKIILSITDDAPILWRDLEISIDGKVATDQFQTDFAKGECVFQPKEDWTDGLHLIDVKIADLYGNSVLAKRCFYLGETPKTASITMREDGCILIGGTPFFPIGVYGVMKREFNNFNLDKAFADLKKAGFNFAHSYNIPRTDEFLAAAQKYGFKLWTVARAPDERFIKIERNHPAILAWYLGDDTSANTTPSELLDRHELVKAVDPTRLTTQADPVDSRGAISNYHDYVHGTDTFLPEIYPVHTKKENSARDCVPITIMDMKRCQSDIAAAQDGPKSIWPIIQYFQGWGWERFPTMRELRAMSFASIIHGANGITWYTYGGQVDPKRKKFNYGVTTSPERWNNISTVACQIRDLSPVLLQRTPKEQPTVKILSGPQKDSLKNDSISCLMKKEGKQVWLLTVNSSLAPIRAEFDLAKFGPFSAETEAKVLYENRGVSVIGGKLTDHFEGLDVHIYKIGP